MNSQLFGLQQEKNKLEQGVLGLGNLLSSRFAYEVVAGIWFVIQVDVANLFSIWAWIDILRFKSWGCGPPAWVSCSSGMETGGGDCVASGVWETIWAEAKF